VELVRSHLVVSTVWLGLALLVTTGFLASSARAQALPDDPFPHDTDDASDPIGVDDSSRSLDQIAAERAPMAAASTEIDLSFGPTPPPPSARAGEILTAQQAVSEGTHRVKVQLEPGRARVDVELTLTSTADKPSEARYRLALPRASWVAELTVCNATGCRTAVPDDADARGTYDAALLARPKRDPGGRPPLPIAHARFADDGSALLVHAAPISKAAPLTLRVRYEADAPMHAGTVRFTLPARGMDPRAAETEIALHPAELLDARVAGQLVRYSRAKEPDVLVSEPWTALPITAQARAGAPLRTDLQPMRCDGAPCVRARAWAGPRELAPRDIVLALDASPSTEGPARGRLLAAIAAVLDAAPSGSRVRALAFAARAEPIVATPIDPGLVALAPFGSHVGSEDLGAATRFDAAWQLAEQWLTERERGASKLRPLLVIVGDGGLSVRAEQAGSAARTAQRAFAKAKRLGVEVSALNVADRQAVDVLRAGVQLTGGIVINAGGSAELAARGAEREPLHEQVVALFAPTVSKGLPGVDLGLLRAGEALGFMGPSRTRAGRSGYAVHGAGALIAVDAQDLKGAEQLARAWPEQPKHIHKKTRCDRRGPASARSGISSDAAPVALAEERVCLTTKASATQQAGKPALGKGMPSDPLLDMLRLRVMPFARDCFRRDRAGKGQYDLRAVFVFALAEREVISADVEGKIPEALRQCLMGAVDTLDVPRFTGTVEVRYPLVTESVPKAEQIQLTQVAAQAIDALIRED
jgi:hypothetical protein